MRCLRYYYLRLKRTVLRLSRARGSTHSIALGVGIGFFVGMAPIMGIQMVVAAGIATLCGANRLAAIVPVWITNPVSFIPVYAFNYWLGRKITGWGASVKEYEAALIRALHSGDQAGNESGFWAGLWASIVDGTHELFAVGWESFWTFLIGCTIVGVTCAAIAYPLTYWLIQRLRQRRNARKARKREKSVDSGQ